MRPFDEPKMVEHGALRRVAPRAAAQQGGSWASRSGKKQETFHEPCPERGCVEDQPQRVAMIGTAAAGAPLPRTQPRSVLRPVHGPNAFEKPNGTPYEPHVGQASCLPVKAAFRLRGAPKRRYGATAASRVFDRAQFIHSGRLQK